jgi:hypothetical protein
MKVAYLRFHSASLSESSALIQGMKPAQLLRAELSGLMPIEDVGNTVLFLLLCIKHMCEWIVMVCSKLPFQYIQCRESSRQAFVEEHW